MIFVPSQEFDDACLVGGVLTFLDGAGPSPAYAILYDGPTELVTIVFSRPCATLVDHALVLTQANPAGELIPVQGDADSFQLFSGDNVLAGVGDVTDAAGDGALRVSGTTGTRLYAGARAILDELTIG